MGVSTRTVRAWLACESAICDDVLSMNFSRFWIEVEQRLQRVAAPGRSAAGSAPPSRSPEGRSTPTAKIAISRKMSTHSAAGELRRHAAPLEPFEHRHQRDGDDQRGGHRQEEFGPGAQRERQGDDQPDAADQGQRGQQPVALGRIASAMACGSWANRRSVRWSCVHAPAYPRLSAPPVSCDRATAFLHRLRTKTYRRRHRMPRSTTSRSPAAGPRRIPTGSALLGADAQRRQSLDHARGNRPAL